MQDKGKYRHASNPERIEAMRELRRSNAAGTHDNRPKRERARRDAKRAAIRRDAE